MAKHLYITTELAAFVAAANLVAAEAAPRRIVVHVADYAQTPVRLLSSAERYASRAYERAGVTVVWTSGHRPATRPEDGDRHVEVVVLAGKMTRDKCREDGLSDIVFGAAVYQAQRAVVFFDRAASFALTSGSPLGVVLGVVLAHEIGHLVLPEGTGHTSDGIMRPHWAGQLLWVPEFTRQQSVQMRAILSAQSAMDAAQ